MSLLNKMLKVHTEYEWEKSSWDALAKRRERKLKWIHAETKSHYRRPRLWPERQIEMKMLFADERPFEWAQLQTDVTQ